MPDKSHLRVHENKQMWLSVYFYCLPKLNATATVSKYNGGLLFFLSVRHRG